MLLYISLFSFIFTLPSSSFTYSTYSSTFILHSSFYSSSSSSSFIFSIGIIHVVVYISASLIKIDLFFIAKKSKRKKEQTIVFLDSRFIPLYIVVKTLEDQRCSTIENK